MPELCLTAEVVVYGRYSNLAHFESGSRRDIVLSRDLEVSSIPALYPPAVKFLEA